MKREKNNKGTNNTFREETRLSSSSISTERRTRCLRYDDSNIHKEKEEEEEEE